MSPRRRSKRRTITSYDVYDVVCEWMANHLLLRDNDRLDRYIWDPHISGAIAVLEHDNDDLGCLFTRSHGANEHLLKDFIEEVLDPLGLVPGRLHHGAVGLFKSGRILPSTVEELLE